MIFAIKVNHYIYKSSVEFTVLMADYRRSASAMLYIIVLAYQYCGLLVSNGASRRTLTDNLPLTRRLR